MSLRRFITCLLFVFFLGSATLSAQDRITRAEYIQIYQEVAIEHMEIYGIPASIKMAQALLESANGNSRLARLANNHFGIKCKSTWTGETISHDDDAQGECFRKYRTANESYLDHSEFLDKSARYQELFKLDPKDYKGWAFGLKKAGYATHPKYAENLITIIEDNKLYLLDQGELIPSESKELAQEAVVAPVVAPVEVALAPEPAPEPTPEPAAVAVVDVDNYSVSVSADQGKHAIYHNNGSEFIIATAGDSYNTLAAEFGLKLNKILSYNDVELGASLAPGAQVYIKAKAKRSQNGKLLHVAKEGDTMHSIAQQYGIRLKNLCTINRTTTQSKINAGQQIRLM